VSYCTDKYELSHTHTTSLIKDSLMTAARDRPHTHTLSIRINAGSLYRTIKVINITSARYTEATV